jgi:hypothetical protein
VRIGRLSYSPVKSGESKTGKWDQTCLLQTCLLHKYRLKNWNLCLRAMSKEDWVAFLMSRNKSDPKNCLNYEDSVNENWTNECL